jgi:hypothetical protein
MINPIPQNINTRYAKKNFIVINIIIIIFIIINWSNKTTSGKQFQIIGTKIINKIPSDILNFSLSLFKKKKKINGY